MSGRKNVLAPYQSMVDGDMSQATLTSDVSSIQYLDNIGVQIDFTDSPVGTFAVEVSADYAQDASSPPNVTNAGNWTAVPITYWDGAAFTTAVSVPTSAGSPIYLDLNQLSAPWLRVVYTMASGTGAANVYVTAKQV